MIAVEERTGIEFPRQILKHNVILSCIVFTLFWTIYPFARAAFRLQVDYNEGWNIYNAERVVNHLPLYPVAYGWQTVNYPALSFAIMAFLHGFTHEYLFTARVVSLLSLVLGCALVGAIVHRLGGSTRASLLAGFFCLGVFCTDASPYVGMDDPQLLAHLFFLLGLFVYLERRKSLPVLAWAAALFVIAGSIKHNPLDFPLAVLLDLTIVSWRRALWFSLCGLVFAVGSVVWNIHFGGPFFVSQMLAPRVWLLGKAVETSVDSLGPLAVPLCIAFATAWNMRHDPRRRIGALLLACSLLIGVAFAGGAGVWINTFFSIFFAMSVVLGLFLNDLELNPGRIFRRGHTYRPIAAYVPVLLFAWLLIPAIVAGLWNPVHELRATVAAQRRFDQETAFLRAHSSPQICESLLLCSFAGEPYIYDPFNATRLVRFGKLDPQLMLDGLRQHSYGVVELEQHDSGDMVQAERFPGSVIAAIQQNYRPVLSNEDVILYLPKAATPVR